MSNSGRWRKGSTCALISLNCSLHSNNVQSAGLRRSSKLLTLNNNFTESSESARPLIQNHRMTIEHKKSTFGSSFAPEFKLKALADVNPIIEETEGTPKYLKFVKAESLEEKGGSSSDIKMLKGSSE